MYDKTLQNHYNGVPYQPSAQELELQKSGAQVLPGQDAGLSPEQFFRKQQMQTYMDKMSRVAPYLHYDEPAMEMEAEDMSAKPASRGKEGGNANRASGGGHRGSKNGLSENTMNRLKNYMINSAKQGAKQELTNQVQPGPVQSPKSPVGSMVKPIISRDGVQLEMPTPNEQPAFAQWLAKNKVNEPFHPDQHYDYASAFRAQEGRGPDQHFTDRFKLPGHETFSDESQYAFGKFADQAGHWDENGKFIPAKRGKSCHHTRNNSELLNNAWMHREHKHKMTIRLLNLQSLTVKLTLLQTNRQHKTKN